MISYRRIYRSALPLGLASLSIVAMGALDAAMVGQLGIHELAATALATSFYLIFSVLGEGYVMPLGPRLARAWERGRGDEAARALVASFIACLPFFAAVKAGLAFTYDMMILCGQQPALARDAAQYVDVVSNSLILTLLFAMCWEIYAALEKTRVMLYASIGMLVLDAVLNYGLIYGHLGLPRLGMIGSAHATVLALGLTVLGLAWHSARALRGVLGPGPRGAPGSLRGLIGKLAGDGLRSALNQVSAVGFMVVSSLIVGTYGAVALGASTVLFQLSELGIVFAFGFADVAAIHCARALARGGHPAAGRVIARTMLAMLLVMGPIVLGLALAGDRVVPAFLSTGDPQFGQVSRLYAELAVIGLPMLLMASASVVLVGVFRGLDDYAVSLRISMFGYWVFGLSAQLALLVSARGGALPVWWVMLATDALILVLQIWRVSALVRRAPPGASAAAPV